MKMSKELLLWVMLISGIIRALVGVVKLRMMLIADKSG